MDHPPSRRHEKRGAQHLASLSSGAHAIAALGKRNEELVHTRILSQPSFFERSSDADLQMLAAALQKAWNDEESVLVVQQYFGKLDAGEHIDLNALGRWIRAHPNDASAVIDCMDVLPPEEIGIIRLLSRGGSQKLVFLATWRLTQQQVVLKKLTGSPEVVSRILLRELQPHPLSLVHKNIIETHHLKNARGESFLVERYLPVVLSDDWRSAGLHEAANLLRDIASALVFLDEHERVHGDVKPDNIGKRNGDYILLDFGICRHKSAFTPEATPTGSLRTRAPELLVGGPGIPEPDKVDVWSLAATVFNALIGRFPLFKPDEKPPRASSPDERERFEAILANRVQREWGRWVKTEELPTPIRAILEGALRQDPSERWAAAELLSRVEKELSVYLRGATHAGHFSPLEELRQLRAYLPDEQVLRLMPVSARHRLRGRLELLRKTPGFTADQEDHIDKLLQLIS